MDNQFEEKEFKHCSPEEQEKRDRRKNYIIIILLVLLMSAIGFAAVSTNLSSDGSNGGVKSASWDVHFENVSDSSKKTEVVKKATILPDSTNLEYSVNLLEPGSYYEFDVDVVNNGTLKAMLNHQVTIYGISLEQYAYTNLNVTYKDGTAVRAGDELEPGERKTLTVRLEVKDNLTEQQLPKTDQQLNVGIDLNYVQTK